MSKDSSNRKDVWDKLSAVSNIISGILIAGIGALATFAYNSHQIELNKLESLNKFRTLLVSENETDREFAYFAFVNLGHEDLAIKFISQNQDEAGKKVLKNLVQESNREKVRESANKALISLERVWVLDNFDSDYKNPPFEDTLTLLDNKGNVRKVISGFNITQSIGDLNPMSASPDGEYVYVCGDIEGKLSKFNSSGNLIWKTNYLDDEVKIDSVAVSSSGFVYALTSKGTIEGHSVLRLDSGSGKVLDEAKIGGTALAVDSQHNSIWIVGSDIKKLNLFLEPVCDVDPITWAAVSVDFDSTGSAWVSERKHSGINDSQNRLLKIDSECKVTNEVALKYSASTIRVHRDENSVWSNIGGLLYKLDEHGKILFFNKDTTVSFAVNQRDGSVWGVGLGEFYKYDRDGKLLLRKKGFSADQKHIVIP